MLVDAAPAIQEEVVTGEVEILAAFSTSVRKAVSASKKMSIAGCKVPLQTVFATVYSTVLCRDRCFMRPMCVISLFVVVRQ